ncbi:MAG: hypothetical protein AAF518_03820 [Spirochaetota bacterium]
MEQAEKERLQEVLGVSEPEQVVAKIREMQAKLQDLQARRSGYESVKAEKVIIVGKKTVFYKKQI